MRPSLFALLTSSAVLAFTLPGAASPVGAAAGLRAAVDHTTITQNVSAKKRHHARNMRSGAGAATTGAGAGGPAPQAHNPAPGAGTGGNYTGKPGGLQEGQH